MSLILLVIFYGQNMKVNLQDHPHPRFPSGPVLSCGPGPCAGTERMRWCIISRVSGLGIRDREGAQRRSIAPSC